MALAQSLMRRIAAHDYFYYYDIALRGLIKMYARFILDRGHIDNSHVCGNPIICLHVKRQGFLHNK